MTASPRKKSGRRPSIVTAADQLRAGDVAAKGAPPVQDDVDSELPEWVQEADRQEAALQAQAMRERAQRDQEEREREERKRRTHQAARYKRPKDWRKIGSFADNFPTMFRALTRYGRKVRWPIKGDPYNGSLSRVLNAYLDSSDLPDAIILFHFMNDALAADFAPTWTVEEFDAEYERLADQRMEREAKARPSSLGGKKSTDQTFRVEMIREAIGCMSRRAYRIDAEGTAILEQRIALAKTFKNDPARCRPRDWEPKFKARGWGRYSERSFRRYVESGADFFEDDLGPALAILLAQYEDGRLPENFQGVRELVAALDKAGIPIDARLALAIFDAFEEWKRPRRSRWQG